MMRKFALVLAACITMASPAFGHETDANQSGERLKLRPNQGRRIASQVASLPVYFLLQTFLHEGSHAMSALFFGWEITEFAPYPHHALVQNGLGRARRELLFGSVSYESPASAERWKMAMLNVSPYLTDFAVFVMSDLMLSYAVDRDSAVAPVLLTAGMVAPLVNFAVNLSCIDDHCDLNKFARNSGIPREMISMAGVMVIAAAFWRCAHHFARLFMETVPNRRHRTAITTPFAVLPSATGLSLIGEF